GAVVSGIPNSVLGGAVIIMFGMIASAGIKMLSGIDFNKRNMLIIALSLATALGLPAQKGLYAAYSENVQAII
ncbi:purine permease, partial [Blautia faecis]|uniref:solute carrier family 23 protein n=1 Tax=Blautia faecis TaxID=871665 RepID=UPI0027D2BFAF